MCRVQEDKIVMLPIAFQKYFISDKSIKQFADNASLEDKLILLAELGINFNLLFMKEDADYNALDGIEKQVLSVDKRLDIISSMKDNDLFAFGSKEVMFSLSLAAMNSHTKVFSLDHRHIAVIDAAKRIKKSYITDDFEQTADAMDIIAKICFSQLMLGDSYEQIFGVKRAEMKILLALYPLRHTFTSADKLMQILQPKESPKGFKGICGTLVEKKYLNRPAESNKMNPKMYYQYILTQNGIKAVLMFIKIVMGQFSS